MSMKQIKVLRDVFEIWPDLHVMGAELNQAPGTVKQWRTRSRIPERMFTPIIHQALKRGFVLSWEHLESVNGKVLWQSRRLKRARAPRRAK